MKIIGAEIRFGVEGFIPVEAAVIPLKIQVPEVLVNQSFRQLTAQLTVHTSDGDHTLELRFVGRTNRPSFQVSSEDIGVGYEQFRKAVEAGS